MSCPSDSGIRYHLTFSSSDQTFPVVILGGPCGFIQGLKKGQWTYQSPGFWHTLGTAMGIKGANLLTFDGQSSNTV